MNHEVVMPEPRMLPRAQEVLEGREQRAFQTVTVDHTPEQTRAAVVTRDGLPLYGVAQGEELVGSTLRALQDALGQTHPGVRDVTAETRELGEGKSYTVFEAAGEKWVALGTDADAVVAGVEYGVTQK